MIMILSIMSRYYNWKSHLLYIMRFTISTSADMKWRTNNTFFTIWISLHECCKSSINEWFRWHYYRYDSTWFFSCSLQKSEKRYKHERKKQNRFRRSSKTITRTLFCIDADRYYNNIQCRKLCIIFRLRIRFHHCE